MTDIKEERFWIDCLCEKHECFGYDNTWSLKVRIEGESCTLLLPDYLPKIDSVNVSINGDLMYVVGVQRQEWSEGRHLGTVVIAKRIDEKEFSAVLWHETYPWALKKLGLDPEPKKKVVAKKRSTKKG